MTPEEMIKAVEDLTHESYNSSTWMQWFNEALQDLSPVLRLETYETVEIDSAAQSNLPGDIQEIRRLCINGKDCVRVGVGDTTDGNTYWIWDDKAYFPEQKTGLVQLWYYRRPARFKVGSSRPDIQEGYEDAIILYAAAKSKTPDRWLEDKSDLYRDYMIRKGQIEQERMRQTDHPRIVKVAPFASGRRWR